MFYRSGQRDGPPGWFIFLLAIAFVFGLYYLWTNFRSYVSTGGLSVAQATAQSRQFTTATAQRQGAVQAALPTRRPTATPRPPCLEFEVTAASAIVRQLPTTTSPLLEALPEGTTICVLQSEEGSDGYLWYLIDRDPITRRIEMAYMREDVVRPLFPTPTPSDTRPPPPTITATFTAFPSETPTSMPATDPPPTPSHTPLPTATPVSVSL